MITFVCSILACMGSDELKAFLTALSGRDMKIRIAEFLQQEDCIAEAMDIAVGVSLQYTKRTAFVFYDIKISSFRIFVVSTTTG